MKKILALLVISVIIIASLSSCNGTPKDTTPETSAPPVYEKNSEDYIKQKFFEYCDPNYEYEYNGEMRKTNFTKDDVVIEINLGIYNDAAVVYLLPSWGMYLNMVRYEWIANCLFIFPDSNDILVLKDEKFYILQDAYDQNILSAENIKTIHDLYDNH